MSEESMYRCVGCDAEMHYMDMLTICGDRWCLACLKAHAEEMTADIGRQAAEIARLTAELAQAREAHKAMQLAYDAATEREPFNSHDELQQLRTSNYFMIAELTGLRAAHKSQSLELAQARAERDREFDARMQWVAWYAGSRVTIKALVVAARAMWWVMDRIASAHQVVHLVNLTRTAISVEAKHIGQQAGE